MSPNLAQTDHVDKPGTWLDAAGLAALVGIRRQQASAAIACCLAGGTWRGMRLAVTEVTGCRGHGGRRYLVAEHSLSLDLRLCLRADQGYSDREAARRLVVDELERLTAEHGRRRAIATVLERANHGDLREALLMVGFRCELKRAALTRWQRDFSVSEEDRAEMKALLAKVEKARKLRAAAFLAERNPPAPSMQQLGRSYKLTGDDIRRAAREARALPAPDPMPRRVRKVA
jgi:hypothetical protein